MNYNFRSSSKLNFSTNVRVLKYLSHQGLKGFSGALKIMLNFFSFLSIFCGKLLQVPWVRRDENG